MGAGRENRGSDGGRKSRGSGNPVSSKQCERRAPVPTGQPVASRLRVPHVSVQIACLAPRGSCWAAGGGSMPLTSHILQFFLPCPSEASRSSAALCGRAVHQADLFHLHGDVLRALLLGFPPFFFSPF